uniref:Uncharacterized protein n=1 Tax=Zea mays TaxID=4577 RepID=C4J8K5_MAIZE|nr:unknown [Zea mays]
MDHNEGQQDNLQSEASISQREKGTSSSSGINHGVDTQPKPNSERSFQYVLMLKKQKSSREMYTTCLMRKDEVTSINFVDHVHRDWGQ